MQSFLLFVLGAVALISPIPLSAWATRGEWRDGVAALIAFGKVIGIMLACGAVLAVFALIASVLT